MIRKVSGKGQGWFPEGRNIRGCKLSFEIEIKGHGRAEAFGTSRSRRWESIWEDGLSLLLWRASLRIEAIPMVLR
jgi:hypothetical protein